MFLMNSNLPYFYHPLRVAFLDDNQAFLDALELEFSDKFNMLTFTNPKQALEAISRNSNNDLKDHFALLNDYEADNANASLIYLDFNKLLTSLYSQKRFEQIAILIVDYEMPNINGLEICAKLKDIEIFKIMLTAEADKDTAISAFNDGLIDRFILKTSKKLHSEILLAVNELTKRYFLNLSALIIAYNRAINNLHNNQSYKNLFLYTYERSKAVEYYLIDNSGSILFLDKNANPTWLLIKNSAELSEQLSLLDGYDISKEILTALTNKEKMLFLFAEADYKKSVLEWSNHLLESKKLDDDYYYVISNKKIIESICWDKVVTYDYYKNKSTELIN